MIQIINDGQWIGGCDSISYNLGQGVYQWGQNVVNRGGIIQTRQGWAEWDAIPEQDPRGCTMVTIAGVTYLLAAIGDSIYKLNLNSTNNSLQQIAGLSFPTATRAVQFEVCVQAQETLPNGTTRFLPTPKFVVVMQDGISEPQYWDGTHAGTIRSLYPDPPNRWTKKGSYMKWVGDRLWVAQGKLIFASDLLNPFQFTENEVTASGGPFYMPDTVTGMGVTHDYKQLLVFTNFTTSAFQVGIEDRTQWPVTQDFQRVILQSIGCASHRTIINQYGMTWWMAHDGVVGLDNALQSYQSSRLDIQDQNMIRSKEGLNWTQGGGAAGAYGNFLFFSVPSGNHWNNHTWVLDQAVINTVAGVTPPAWCANWTGIRPEQWVTGQVRGQQRCFCISRDLTNEGHQTTVWEAFIGQRMDCPEVNNVKKAKDIGCAFESRFYGLSPSQYCELKWVELDVAEIVGDVFLQVYYCGRRTSYKQIVSTHLTATVTPNVEEIFNEPGVHVYVPQYRTIRSFTDTDTSTDNNTEIQTAYLRNIDREFSILVMWVGQMALTGLRLAVEPRTDYEEGSDAGWESLNRRIEGTGEGTIGCTLPDPNTPSGHITSKFIAPQKPRWVEFPSYDSAVPNGVFFVSELTATPPPGEYPINLFPLTVRLTSETQGIDIYYTHNGQVPHGPPDQVGTHYDNAHLPSVNFGQTLKAVGERDNMQPSVLLSGKYTRAQCADPVFSPVGGDYPANQFPPDGTELAVRIECDTPEAHIHWRIWDNGGPINESDLLYDPSHPIHPYPHNIIKAKAFKTNYLPSNQVTAKYDPLPLCAQPTFSPAGDDYPASDYTGSGKAITLHTATSGAKIRYTINNTDVTHGAKVNNGTTIHVHANDVLRAVAQKANFADSEVTLATYGVEVEQVSPPSITPQNQTVYNQVHQLDVTIDCATPNAVVAYTLHSPSDPADHPTQTNGTHITTLPATLHIDNLGHRVLRVIAFRADMNDSIEVVGEYDHEWYNTN